MFFSQVVSYAGWEKATWIEDQNKQPEWPKEAWDDTTRLEWTAQEAQNLWDKMKKTWDELAAWAEALKSTPEKNEKITPLSTKEVLKTMKVPDWEKALAARELWEWASKEAVLEKVFESRVEALSSNEISQWDKKIIEAEFIEDIEEKAWIEPGLIWDLRALWFQWAQDWAEWDVAKNLEDMTRQLSDMKKQIEADGWEFPKTKEEFLALYEVMNANEWEKSEQISPDAATQLWASVIKTENGASIDPEAPGSQVVWDTVIASNGSYSRWWNVYAPQRSVWSWPTVDISTVKEWMSDIVLPNDSPELKEYSHESNKEIIRSRVPAEWHGAAIDMAKKVGTMQPNKMIALASMTWENGPEAIVCYPGGKVNTFPIIIGAGSYWESVTTWDKKTPVNTLFNFDAGNVAGRGKDASKWGSSTVLWWAVYSPEAWAMWGRWWHGVADSRIPGGKTHGCIGAKQENMMAFASAVNQYGGWYGMNVAKKSGKA